ncbi:MAG: O-antigen ligase family protein [Pseudomonadota bacterium]
MNSANPAHHTTQHATQAPVTLTGGPDVTRKQGEVTNPAVRRRLRQIALLAGILMSGGLLLIPREPVLVIVVATCFILKNPLRLFRPEFALIWMVLFAVAGVVLIGGESFQLTPMIIRYANFFAGLTLLLVYIDERRSTLADDLYPILKLMAFQAILTPIAFILFSRYFFSVRVFDTEYTTFYFLFTFHEFQDYGAMFKRPDGFFFEPGVFQIYLNVFLFICLFVRRQSPVDIAIATAAVLATQSTAGVVIMLVQFAYAYFVWLRTADRSQKLGVFVFVPIMLLPLAAYMSYNVTEKFYGALSGSAEAREYDLRTGISVALEQPLTGIGFDYEKYFDIASRVGYREAQLSKENITERGNTNGIVVLFYSLGIPLALVFLTGLFRQRLFRPGLLMGALAALSLISESLSLTPFFLMLLFSGLLIQPKRVTDIFGKARAPHPAPISAAPRA